MTGTAYKGIYNREYKAGALIGTGGEGSVYEAKGDQGIVLKIYHESPNLLKAGKLRRMVAIKDDTLLSFSAWPVDILYDAKTGANVGFVMNRLFDAEPIHRLFSPFDRKQYFPNFGYNFLVHVAVNLAKAVSLYHQHGIIIGDVNEGNIQILKDGRVIFIDCDSFQVKKDEQIFYCEVGIPRYTAPELLEVGSFERLERSANSDIFSLAVLIFQLIFLGRHPFVGVNLTTEEIDEEKAIKNFIFPYSVTTAQRLSPPPNSLSFKQLSPGLIKLFTDAFENRATQYQRPGVDLWIHELSVYLKQLKICNNSKLHFYSPNADSCPWCDFIKTQGIYYFVDDALKNAPLAAKEIDYLRDLEYFINDKGLFIQFNDEHFDYTQVKVKDFNYQGGFMFSGAMRWLVVFLIIGITGALSLVNVYFAFGGIGLLAVFLLIKPFDLFLNKKRNTLKTKYRTVKNRYEVHIREYNEMFELRAYNKYKMDTEALIKKYKALPENYKIDKKKIDTGSYEEQLNAYLKQFLISEHEIENVGPGRKEKLYEHQIYNAADIQSRKIILPGFGRAVTSALINWRLDLSSGFVYIPDEMALFRKLTQLNTRYAESKRDIAENIVSNIIDAKKLEPQIEQKRNRIKTTIFKLARDLKVAELVYQDFESRFFKVV